MPDQLNKQTLINLLIDSPLREPIKINLIDIVNNTSEPDLPKVFPTITKELEIFQKATERRMKLADETISKLGGTAPPGDTVTPATSSPMPAAPAPSLPPLPTPPSPAIASAPAGLSVPPLDLPPLPTMPTPPSIVTPAPNVAASEVGPTPPTPLHIESDSSREMTPGAQQPGSPPMASSDEAALAEIQKELDSLKSGVAADATPAAPATPQA